MANKKEKDEKLDTDVQIVIGVVVSIAFLLLGYYLLFVRESSLPSQLQQRKKQKQQCPCLYSPKSKLSSAQKKLIPKSSLPKSRLSSAQKRLIPRSTA